MTWKEMLQAHAASEKSDHADYMHMAEMAEQDGCFCEAGVLRDIAHEEKMHHKLVMEIVTGDRWPEL